VRETGLCDKTRGLAQDGASQCAADFRHVSTALPLPRRFRRRRQLDLDEEDFQAEVRAHLAIAADERVAGGVVAVAGASFLWRALA